MVKSERKKARINLSGMEASYNFILQDLTKYNALEEVKQQLEKIQDDKFNTECYVENNLKALTEILFFHKFISYSDLSTTFILTEQGRIAATLQEVHPLAMTNLYYKTNQFAELSATDLAGFFSCFYPLNVSDEYKIYHSPDRLLYTQLLDALQIYQKKEEASYLNTGSTYELYYDLVEYVRRWCDSQNELECKLLIQEMKTQTGIFLGEFIKALLKINAIAAEFEQVCEITQNMALLEILREIPKLTLKYVATNQSLYL
jgi:hypothetical protein